MSEISLFLLGVGLSSLFGIGVAVYIRKPLHTVLVDLCGTGDRALFWTQITLLSFVLMTALMALSYQPDEAMPPYYYLGGHLGRTLTGLLLITGFLTLTVSRFIRRQQKYGTPAAGGK
jgi:hypothetical protein